MILTLERRDTWILKGCQRCGGDHRATVERDIDRREREGGGLMPERTQADADRTRPRRSLDHTETLGEVTRELTSPQDRVKSLVGNRKNMQDVARQLRSQN